MNEADGQLQAAHVILGYTPLSLAFQALKYVIKGLPTKGSLFQRVSEFLKVLPVPNHFLWPPLQ